MIVIDYGRDILPENGNSAKNYLKSVLTLLIFLIVYTEKPGYVENIN